MDKSLSYLPSIKYNVGLTKASSCKIIALSSCVYYL